MRVSAREPNGALQRQMIELAVVPEPHAVIWRSDEQRVFEGDDSGDLSKTMAALDGRLKTAERWAQTFEKYKVSRRETVSESRAE